jgi:hypothetical protein
MAVGGHFTVEVGGAGVGDAAGGGGGGDDGGKRQPPGDGGGGARCRARERERDGRSTDRGESGFRSSNVALPPELSSAVLTNPTTDHTHPTVSRVYALRSLISVSWCCSVKLI